MYSMQDAFGVLAQPSSQPMQVVPLVSFVSPVTRAGCRCVVPNLCARAPPEYAVLPVVLRVACSASTKRRLIQKCTALEWRAWTD
jgi:hypothetical protein